MPAAGTGPDPAGGAVTVSETEWGGWPAIQVADRSAALVLVPQLGARITSFLDRRTGREWLMRQDMPSREELAAWTGEGAVFGGNVSFGWDECLPTVAPCLDPTDQGAAPLRDHGDQWGRPAEFTVDAGGVTTTWPTARWAYRFQRRISLEGDGVVRADYLLTSLADQPLPMLWSMHPTFQVEEGTRIDVPGVESMRLTWVAGWDLQPGLVAWPSPSAGLDLSVALGIEASAAAKLYASGATRLARAVAPDGASLEILWDHASAPALGVWLAYGGWPPGGEPIRQIALEPTSSPDDHLADAITHRRAWSLAPAETRRWWVRLASRPAP